MTGYRPDVVLAVDDDTLSLKLLMHTLGRLGVPSVVTHDNGPAALAWLDGGGTVPDLIVLDLNMPDMDGLEFVRHLVARAYRGNLILCSGENDRLVQTAHRLVSAHDITVLGHLSKPVSLERLRGLLERPRRERGAISPGDTAMFGADAVREAIDAGQLVLHYQPQIDLRHGTVVGAEALVRWQHPDEGLVGPGRFVAVAEQAGLIGRLTRNVLSLALAQQRAWRDDGLSLRLAVNVSMDNLSSLDFADFVSTLAARHAIEPCDITLEVTESQLVTDLRVPLEVMTRLRMKRFGLSIDDFGTGHSSLAQLRDVPFDELKIDRGFVHRAHEDATLRAIYDASLRLARQLDMSVVAEGVEDDDDWRFVHATGCDTAQGFHMSRPLPATHFADWVGRWNGGGR